MIDAASAVVRAVHFGAAVVLFGEWLFASAIAGSAWRRAEAVSAAPRTLDDHLGAVTRWALVASAVSGLAWLVIEAATMAGAPLGEALRGHTIAVVLVDTEFGRVWCLRIVLLVTLAVAAASIPRAANEARRARRAAVVLVLAALYLATLAWVGHAAAAEQGRLLAIHLASDASHTLAAGAWLGALPGLTFCLRSTASNEALARVTQRFSRLGIASVAVLLASGIVNACFLVGTVPALFGSAYGRLLIVKVAMFGVMLAIAAVNRSRLTPRLIGDGTAARRLLTRNTALEILGGALILVIVGALGTMVPAAHESPDWPFPFTLDPSRANVTDSGRIALAAIAFAALAVIIAGVRRHAAPLSVGGLLALLLCAAASTWVLAVPAHPTTYAVSPVPYTAEAIARGAARFATQCSSCHGAEGRGDGAAAATLSRRPANLVDHASRHPQGDLFWWIAHGIPGTPMPAFSPSFGDAEIWKLVEFLMAQSAARAAMAIGPRVDASSRVRVPDFTYELPQQGQQSLLRQRAPALIVLYSLPQSMPRLDALASDPALADAKLRIIAIPMAPTEWPVAAHPLLQTRTSADVGAVYARFARAPDGSLPLHAELLIDAGGFLRARWSGIPESAGGQTAAIVGEARRLSREHAQTPSTAPPHHH